MSGTGGEMWLIIGLAGVFFVCRLVMDFIYDWLAKHAPEESKAQPEMAEGVAVAEEPAQERWDRYNFRPTVFVIPPDDD